MARPQRAPDYSTPHMKLWLEPPDVVFIAGEGELVAEDMSETAVFYDKHVRDWPHLFVIGDQTKQTGTSAGARKTASKVFDWVPFRGIALIGGSFTDRTLGKMILTLINTLFKRDNPVVFVNTEEEARAWIDSRRRELAKT